MKPVRLTIEGINSFIAPQTVDFEAAGRSNLFCICGKTGAGKTTIFDSIMLALYGQCSKGNLADVVNLSLMTGKVSLEFSENGELYTVERTIKCRFEKDGAGNRTDKRIAVSDCTLGKNGVPVAKGGEANDRIREIIGLDSTEFKNVYLLEQGEYAEFLKKTPAKQTEAVGKIFSLMRFSDVHKRAADRARAEQSEIDRLKRGEEDIADATPERLQAEKHALSVLRAKTTALNKDAARGDSEISSLEKLRDAYLSAVEKQRNVRQLMIGSDEAKKTAYAAKRARESFESERNAELADTIKQKREELNALSALNALDREYEQTRSVIPKRRAALSDRREKLSEAEARYAAAEETAAKAAEAVEQKQSEFAALARSDDGTDTLKRAVERATEKGASEGAFTEARYALEGELEKYGALLSSYKSYTARAAALDGECGAELAKIEQYAADIEKCNNALAEATANREKTAAELAEARKNSHALAVRAELNEGEVCPVCGGVYHGGAECGETDVEKHTVMLERADELIKSIERDISNRRSLSDVAAATHSSREKERREAVAAANEAKAALDAMPVSEEKYRALIAALDALKLGAAQAARAAENRLKLGPELSRLRAECEAAESALAETEEKAEKYRARLGESCGRTAGKIASVKSELDDAERRAAAEEAEAVRLASEERAAQAAVAAFEQSLSAAQRDCPTDLPPFDEGEYAEKRAALDRLKKQIAENERDIAVKDVEVAFLAEKCEKRASLRAEIADRAKRAKTYETIAEMTRGKAMLNFVANEYITDFTAVASDMLSELSQGKFTMSYDEANGFTVYDYLNDGKARRTDTLSGGELFLASLSVAIAIARTQSSGNNAFFFLDEGFGTLDEELIDVVYGALESLSRDCLVGVITHAEALISRMPYCVAVHEATDLAGSRIEQ